MTTNNDNKSWWTSLQGIITSIATLITAIGGLLVILNVNGYFSKFKKEDDSVEKVDHKKQFFNGNVGKLEANFELSFDFKKKKVTGVYSYVKRPGISYDLIGIIKKNRIEMNELTNNQVTASFYLEPNNEGCYSGMMSNTNGNQYDMNLCKTLR